VSGPSSPALLRGLALIGLASISWGTTGSVTTILVVRAGATPLLVGIVRVWLAAALLILAARIVTGSLSVARADRLSCVAMGVCMAVFQVAYFTAVILTGIAVAALVAICTVPLMIAALATLFLGESLTPRGRLALAVGVLGTALLIVGPRATVDLSPRFLAGALLALIAGLAYALYAVISKASLARTAPLPLSAVTFTVAAVLLTPGLLVTETPARQIALGWPWLLYLGTVTTAGAYALYTIGLRRVPASMAGIVALLEPLTATLLGMFLFGERLGVTGVLGGILLFGSIGLLLSTLPREAPAPTRRPSSTRTTGRGD
jgi:DME family drug/metabolite transporter